MTTIAHNPSDLALALAHNLNGATLVRPPSRSLSKSRRSLTSLARERTSTAIASLSSKSTPSSPPLRSVPSSRSLSNKLRQSTRAARQSVSHTDSPPSPPVPPVSPPSRRLSGVKPTAREPVNIQSVGSPMADGHGSTTERGSGRMHQTSSKVLRMTDDDRPFTRDFKDLFSTLMTSLPFGPHRVRFSRVEETFLSEEAISNLSNLRFTQSNRIPDPDSPQRWVVTTTTTTFSMNKEMARTMCQRFVDARLIESAESKSQAAFTMKGGVWKLTAKGLAIVQRFCSRNGIVARQIDPMIRRDQMQIVTLERDPETDKLNQDKATVEVIFRRFVGQEGLNLKSTPSLADSDSVSEYASGLIGVKMARERRVQDKVVHNTFTGRAASDWLLDCTTTIDRNETYEMAELFVKCQLITPVLEDRAYIRTHPSMTYFQPTKFAVYTITERGLRLCPWSERPPSTCSEESRENGEKKTRMPRDSNVARLHAILGDAALRLLFKEFLRASLCEENLLFYLDVHDFTANYRALERSGSLDRPESLRESLAAAYGLYNSFLASGAPSELNLDFALRNRLDSRMIRTNTEHEATRRSLQEVVELFEQAQNTVFKLMASDSVPKFIRQPQYASILRDHEFDVADGRAFSPVPESSLSRSNTGKARTTTTIS
ncbi:hypothetical protein DV738_g4826, partial [Chaetothyriales sp. CBS 135597]